MAFRLCSLSRRGQPLFQIQNSFVNYAAWTPIVLSLNFLNTLKQDYFTQDLSAKKIQEFRAKTEVALKYPGPIFERKHEQVDIISSRKSDYDDLRSFFNDVLNAKYESSFLSGMNCIGKSELIKQIVKNVNKDEEDPLKIIYIRCDRNSETFKYNFGEAFNIIPEPDVSFAGLRKIAELSASAVTSETIQTKNGPQNRKVLIVIDDISRHIGFLGDLQFFARQFSEKKNCSVCLIGTDGTALLATTEPYQGTRCRIHTIHPFNAEQMIEYCQTLIDDKIIAKDIGTLVATSYTPDLIQVRDLFIDFKGDSLTLDNIKGRIDEKTARIAKDIKGLCYSIAGEIKFEKRLDILKSFVGEKGNKPFSEDEWLTTIENPGTKLAFPTSLAYELLKKNYLLHIPEKKELQFVVPMVENAIKMI